MHRKGSMELSVNSIVILVIAVVMMGLILGFIRSKFTDIGGGFIMDEGVAPEATASDPITLSRNIVTVTGTKKTGLNINFYNTDTRPLLPPRYKGIPHFDCKGNSPIIIGEYFEKIATKSNMTTFNGNIRLGSSVPKDTYLCKVCFIYRQGTGNNNMPPNSTKCFEEATENIVASKEFQLVVK